MGRSYEMKEGRKVLLPTQRQLEALRSKQDSAQITDSKGRNGMELAISDIPAIEKEIKAMGLTEKQKKEILENGRATDEFINLKILQILKDLRDKKSINEKDDKKFKFALDNLVKKWADSEVEMGACYDKNNRFLGYTTQGKGSSVEFSVIAGSLAGGTTLHSHPSSPDRFFGGSFSVGDFKSFRDYGEKTMVVTSREGQYILERKGPVKLLDKDINLAFLKYEIRATMSTTAFKDNKTTKKGYTTLELAVWRDHHNAVKSLASSAGLEYKFIPKKGFEELVK